MIEMNVQEILDGKEKLIDFLKIKNFEPIDFSDIEYPNGYYFQITKRKILVIYEIENKDNLKEVKDHFLIDRGLSYCIIIFESQLLFFRSFGENKHFIYSKNTKTNASKLKKLEKIDESIDLLFHTKDISKRFYESFKIKRNLLVKHIENDIDPTKKFLLAQKIFDRVFFIYFLCHKNIIKFEDGRIISGKSLFSEILLEHENFFENLQKLFDLFNTKNEKETNINILEISHHKLSIPFLNGGLFRLEDMEYNLEISLNKDQWRSIFEFLNSYYWIIEDVKTTDEDVDKVLTPEILGHVYERSVVEWELKGFSEVAEEVVSTGRERKKKGVYYTPESITDFIANKTVLPYLLDNFNGKFENFEDLVDSNDENSIKKAIKILDEIKILDPACGSGAFLTKAAELIFSLKRRLNYVLGNEIDPHNLKLDVITKNIYGVDILSGAVEISQLRLWLWVIANYKDNKVIEPLPNIEYNIMCGNSLLGFIEPKGRRTIRTNNIIKKTDEFEKIKLEYKRCHTKTSDTIRDLISEKLDSLRSELNELYIDELNSKEINIVKVKKNSQFNFYGEETTKANYIYKNEFEKKYKPFHWILEFSEVFKTDSPGFDIIIGNPPYGNLLKGEDKELISFYQTKDCNEIAANFVERSVSLLNKNSYFGQIIANSIAINSKTSICRDIIRDSFNQTNMALFGTRPTKIFSDAEIRVMILIAHKNGEKGEIYTTDAIKLTKDTKDHFEKFIRYESTTGLELGEEKIGVGKDTALPKIGHKEIKLLLQRLKSKSTTTFSYFIGPGKYKLDLRKTGGYWLNALEVFPYRSTKIVEISFDNKIIRDFALILLNSSLFYIYWSTYGNLRDLPPALFYKFPCPDQEQLEKYKQDITDLNERINLCLNKNFYPDKGQVGEFTTAKCKNIIDESDKLLSKFYCLDDILDFIINYDNHIRPNQSK